MGVSKTSLSWLREYYKQSANLYRLTTNVLVCMDNVAFDVDFHSGTSYIQPLRNESLQSHVQCKCHQYIDDATLYQHTKLGNGCYFADFVILGCYFADSNLV